MSRTPEPGETVTAKVVHAAAYGIHLDRDGFKILVHITDVPWISEIAPTDYAKPGEALDVRILRLTDDGTEALGWLPWPRWHPETPPTPAAPD